MVAEPSEQVQAASAPVPENPPAPAPVPTLAATAPRAEPALRRGWLQMIPGFRRRGALDYLRQAQRFVEKQNYRQAVLAYEQALEADSNCTRAFQGIALVLARRGTREHLRKALGQMLKAVQVDPYDPQNYRVNALIYQKLGSKKHMQIELRCMAITHTLRRNPEHPVANNQMGVLLLRQFRMDLAAEHFQRALQAQPRYEAALRNLARICISRAESADPQVRSALLSQAAQHVQKALDEAPSSAAWTILARIRVMNGQAQEAMEAVEQAETFKSVSKDLPLVKQEVQVALATMAPQAAQAAADAPNSPPIG